jgi:hypothetical protein
MRLLRAEAATAARCILLRCAAFVTFLWGHYLTRVGGLMGQTRNGASEARSGQSKSRRLKLHTFKVIHEVFVAMQLTLELRQPWVNVSEKFYLGSNHCLSTSAAQCGFALAQRLKCIHLIT